MALDTNTKKTRSSFDKLMDLYWGGSERRISALTVRIIGINALSLIVLMIGITSLSSYETKILNTKLEAFQKETMIIAEALKNENENLQKSLQNLQAITGHIINLYDLNGKPITNIRTLPATPKTPAKVSTTPLRWLAKLIKKLSPRNDTLPAYPAEDKNPPNLAAALNGAINIAAWKDKKDSKDILLTGISPLIQNGQITGAVHIIRSGSDIVEDINNFWLQMLNIFWLTLIATIIISIYLSGTIAQPLRRLTRAAESIRKTKSPTITIPDLSKRLDEIGELSLVMQDMTDSMWGRIDTIERFSADVAHELKNPLTSLKSAVETLKISKKKKDQETLLTLLEDDIQRMDRLISDISAASRLDTELSRESLKSVNLSHLIHELAKRYDMHSGKNVTIVIDPSLTRPLWVQGIKDRLTQVFDNILTNALSFSKDGDIITLKAASNEQTVTITIEDQGPGIPENKLETIFERFYSERPQHETYGKHSGLGLSICKQIITAHGGSIKAENKTSSSGATFMITLNIT